LIAPPAEAMLRAALETPAWKRGDFLLAGGVAAGLAAVAETVASLYGRFAADLAGLSAADRAGLALWDFRPLGAGLFALAGIAILTAPGPARMVRPALAVVASGFAALGVLVLVAALWIGARGYAGDADGLAIRFTDRERVTTIVTQMLGWAPLVGFFALLALWLTKPSPSVEEPESQSVIAEMDELWRERLAYSPRRERGRELLARIRALEAEGNLTEARELAEEMRRL
jgi:hypothetical protein